MYLIDIITLPVMNPLKEISSLPQYHPEELEKGRYPASYSWS
jgi:hypothetical protein